MAEPRRRNAVVAARLGEVAELLAVQEASPYRVAAYRRAAATIAALEDDVGDLIARGGVSALTSLPGIDRALAGAIAELLRSGRLQLLDRLRGTLDAEALFRTLPGVGPKLARRLHDALGVDTLEALEVAAYDGRLDAVPGIGKRRAAALRASLQAALRRVRGDDSRALAGPPPAAVEPTVAELLDVDAEYRRRAAAGELYRIAPRRLNPDRDAWLPVLHTDRGRWHLTALYSNTPRAHELGRTGDWVIVYFADDGHHDRQRTVVTETRGALAGRRVVRGREPECLRHYAAADAALPTAH